MRQVDNWAAISPFSNNETQIRWTLALMDDAARMWADEQLDLLDQVPPPAHLQSWTDFQTEFENRWSDPHESKKAQMKIMSGTISQKTLVKLYNDKFNDQLALSGLNGTDAMVLLAYELGLKEAGKNIAIAPLHYCPAIAFHQQPALTVQLNEDTMQTRRQLPGA